MSPKRTSRVALLIGLVLATALVASCGSSGRDLPPPVPGAVQPTRSTEAPNSTGPFTLTSDAFTEGGLIPEEYACQGPSPQLTWAGALPEGVAELALVVRDKTFDGFVHWFVAGIGVNERTSPKGGTPPNVAQLKNGLGQNSWFGPCALPGPPHTYEFEILALSSPAGLPVETPGKDAYEQIQSKVVTRATLNGVRDTSVLGSVPAGNGASTSTTS